jgi:hypothetical protein
LHTEDLSTPWVLEEPNALLMPPRVSIISISEGGGNIV